MRTPDVIIVGSGIAGLSLAIKLSELNPDYVIRMVSKQDAFSSNTRFAQGGIAAVINTQTDSFEKHILDTLKSGGNACNENIVRSIVQQAPTEIEWLRKQGVAFDVHENGELHLALEGGHQQSRVVHVQDQTGLNIVQVLLNKIALLPHVTLSTHLLVTDLSKDAASTINGVWVYNSQTQEVEQLLSTCVVLATGGCGQLFEYTTNPSVAIGDGYAMALRAGAVLKDMQYMQFHPTALYSETQKDTLFLISEAVRGFGAFVVNKEGKRFLFDTDIRGELATRDIVSAAIQQQLNKTENAQVYLDVRHLNQDEFATHFPTIYNKLIELGIHPSYQLIPIVPAAHYQCGGIAVNNYGETSLANLFALGEVGCTGLHGKNRLASNSLLEALVIATNAAHKIASQYATNSAITNVPERIKTTPAEFVWLKSKRNGLKKWMSICFITKDIKTIITASEYTQKIIDLTRPLLQHYIYSEELLALNNMAHVAKHMLAELLKQQQIALQSKLPSTHYA